MKELIEVRTALMVQLSAPDCDKKLKPGLEYGIKTVNNQIRYLLTKERFRDLSDENLYRIYKDETWRSSEWLMAVDEMKRRGIRPDGTKAEVKDEILT
jgi:hypothetical protein